MSDLREKLARRLGTAYRTAAGWQEPDVHPGDRPSDTARGHVVNLQQQAVWLAVADECIRQMEWAFNQGASARCPYDCKGCRICADMDAPALTPAPEDWRPE